MKLKINVDGKEKEVEIKGLKGRHRKKFIQKIQGIAKTMKSDKLEAVGMSGDFLDFQDDLAIEVTSLSKEEFEELELEDANKIVGAIRSILFPGEEVEGLF